jgi:hypothetical protein
MIAAPKTCPICGFAVVLDTGYAEAGAERMVCTADGEGYELHVICHETARMDRLELPYTDAEWLKSPALKRPPHTLTPNGGGAMSDDEWEQIESKIRAKLTAAGCKPAG